MGSRVLSLPMRPPSPPLSLGILAAAALIGVETLAVYPLRNIAPELSLGVVYLLGVLVVSMVWGLALGAATAVLSTAAFDFFFVSPVGSIVFEDSHGQAALAILLAVALLLSVVAALARSRAIDRRREDDERRRDADLAAEMARLLLGTDDLRSALPEAAARLAYALGLPTAAIELEAVAGGDGRAAFPLRDGDTPLGTLLVPAELPRGAEVRLRERVVPSVEALLRAAREREAMRSALESSRDELGVLADEQAALRRVATLVARGAAPEEVFAAVTEEVGRLLPVDFADMSRCEPDGAVTFVAAWGTTAAAFPVGSRWTPEGKNLCSMVAQTGRPARIESYADASGPIDVAVRETGVRSAVGTPIIVDGRLWGVMAAGSRREEPLAADTEARLTQFTALLATAVGNAESRAGLARLAQEQAALRRVATLVARGTRPEEVFAAVTNEVGRLLSVDLANMARYEADGTLTFVASAGELVPVGSRWPLGGQKNLATLVFETGRSARIDDYADATGPLADEIREAGICSAVATPIIVERRLWGLIAAGSSQEQPLPPDTEARLASFTELVATAISNTEARAEVAASRTRIVAATDEERRRVVRDLHDGAQQRLVHTILTLTLAADALQNDEDTVPALVSEAREHAAQANAELRELAHGILPTVLTQGGLRAGVAALASRTPVPVEVDVSVDRLPTVVEATAYFVVAEALTNVAKHSRAAHAEVTARIEDGTLAVHVRDDGVGGARANGSGLLGLADRLAALDSELRVESPAGGGTLVAAAIPLPG
jgi:signal transduction histidine kinase